MKKEVFLIKRMQGNLSPIDSYFCSKSGNFTFFNPSPMKAKQYASYAEAAVEIDGIILSGDMFSIEKYFIKAN